MTGSSYRFTIIQTNSWTRPTNC